MKARNLRRTTGTVLGLTVSLILVNHLALLIFTDLTLKYHGFWIWIVLGVLTAIAGLLLLGKDEEK